MTITDKAAEKAKAILADEGKANWGIRIYVAGESCCGPSFGLNLQEVQMPEDEIVESIGAGDAFDAGLIVGHLSGWPVERSALFATLAAASSLRGAGGSQALDSRADLEKALENVRVK